MKLVITPDNDVDKLNEQAGNFHYGAYIKPAVINNIPAKPTIPGTPNTKDLNVKANEVAKLQNQHVKSQQPAQVHHASNAEMMASFSHNKPQKPIDLSVNYEKKVVKTPEPVKPSPPKSNLKKEIKPTPAPSVTNINKAASNDADKEDLLNDIFNDMD